MNPATRLPLQAAAAWMVVALATVPVLAETQTPGVTVAAGEGTGATAADAGASAGPTFATAHITYVTGTSAYVDAGRDEGLREGDRLEVVRQDAVVAVLEVTFLSPHRSVCMLAQGSSQVSVGDEARFVPHDVAAPPPSAVPLASTGTAALAEPRRPPSGPRPAGVRGRVGVRYFVVRDRDDAMTSYSQPGLDLRLDGSRIGGTPLGLNVDVRARRTTQTLEDGSDRTDGRTRVYAMALTVDDLATPLRFTLGRQFSSALATVSIFDGLTVEYAKERWSIGVLGGTQPDVTDMGYSTEIQEYGAYQQVRSAPTSARRWEITTGAIGSYEQSEVNREFLYLQGHYIGPRLSLYLAEEVDYNRGWKAEAGEDTVSPTSTFFSLNYRMGRVASLRAGYDNRRNVRLYRDRVTPETEFDDAYRQGVWAGTLFNLRDRVQLGLDARTNGGGEVGDADSYTLTVGLPRLLGRAGVGTRTTRYASEIAEGWLQSLTVGVPAGSRVNLDLNGGVRDETNLANPALDDRIVWYGLDVDVGLGRRWYALLSLERSQGTIDEVDQAYLSLTYRF